MERLVSENAGILDVLFTTQEQDYCRGKRRVHDHLAGRFAAKEAVLKALGTGIAQRMLWTDVEIVPGSRGRPEVCLHGEVAAWAEKRGLADVDVSLAHSAGMAVAQALAVWDREAEDSRSGRERSVAVSPD